MEEYTETITPQGELFMPPDVDAARDFFNHKPRAMTNKLMSVQEAVARFVHNGDYLASGGFGSVRISTAVLHEIVRQRIKNLGLAGHTATHDFQILAAGKCFDRCDVAYVVGLEMRGLSPNARRWMESGRVKATEWSNGTLSWRFRAAAMGVPFLPTRSLMGTDVYAHSAARPINCPFTGLKLAALPALYPDVAVIHVHRADEYGNAQIDGISIADYDVARAAKRLIITTERLVSTADIRRNPSSTIAPYWLTDAVCLVPYGSYPGNMPYEYASDEDHIAEWIAAEKDDATLDIFLNKYLYGTANFEEYLALKGGAQRMAELRNQEPLQRNCI